MKEERIQELAQGFRCQCQSSSLNDEDAVEDYNVQRLVEILAERDREVEEWVRKKQHLDADYQYLGVLEDLLDFLEARG
jgi:hypothetical protein